MRARVCVLIVAGLAVGAVGCSSPGGSPAAASSPVESSAAPQPTAPSAALCAAARTLVAGARPTFAADADAPLLKQAGDDSAFYTQLLQVFSENGGADPLSVSVSRDAQAMARDYVAVESAAQDNDMDKQVAALKALTGDLGRLTTDQVPFDTACGIPGIVGAD